LFFALTAVENSVLGKRDTAKPISIFTTGIVNLSEMQEGRGCQTL
jgi:hypothetical protein